MSNPVHTIELMDGSTNSAGDRLKVGMFKIANVIGGGAGQAVATAVVFSTPMPADYMVHAESDQDAVCYASSKTPNGFTLNMSPRLAANTLAVGKTNVLIIG